MESIIFVVVEWKFKDNVSKVPFSGKLAFEKVLLEKILQLLKFQMNSAFILIDWTVEFLWM